MTGADLKGGSSPPTAMKLHWSKRWRGEKKGGRRIRREENEVKMEVEGKGAPHHLVLHPPLL